MYWTPAHPVSLALAPLRLQDSAQDPAQASPEPVKTVNGQDFYTWEEYVSSPLFQQLGLRCGTRFESTDLERPQSDCSSSSTTIRPEYTPAGHTLYRIPVVVHIIKNTSGSGEISDAMVQSQIDVLNEDFQAIAGTLGENGNDARIEFFLATTDPNGNPTTGITRSVNNTWYSDGGSYWDTLRWNPFEYLNIYTNNTNALGYVPTLPSNGIVGANSDRVVVLWSAFGRNAPIGPPFHLGRTATHEVGHYLGLYHTFDFGCGTASCYTTGDRICDTPGEANPVFGCPAFSDQCAGGGQDPFHNYMDYSDDICYQEFTLEQINRMRCTLANWRVVLDDPACGTLASNAVRAPAQNPNVFSATTAVLGGAVTFTVNDPLSNLGVIYGYSAPANFQFPNGQWRLVNPTSQLFYRLPIGLPPNQIVVGIPNEPILCGLTAYSQVTLRRVGGVVVLSNAVDMTAGF